MPYKGVVGFFIGGFTMGKKYHHLTKNDRLRIEALFNVGLDKQEIADEIGVHPSTIYRELKRGYCELRNTDYTMRDAYSPDKAEEKYRENLKAKGRDLKIGADHEYAEYLEYKVAEEKYSPGAVLGEIKAKGLEFETTISKTTFYRYINMGLFLHLTNKDLPVKRNKTAKYKKVKKAKRAAAGTSIEKRPEEIESREEFGHWEMDCVVGKQGTKEALLVLTERKTRDEIIRLLPDKTVESVIKAIDGIEKKLGAKTFSKLFKTITCDNGSEFSDPNGIEGSKLRNGKRSTLFYCHPYCSCERGSNENQNRLVRRHYPKGYDFSNTTAKEVKKVQDWINNYPREMFGWHTSKELYDREMELLLAA